MNKFRRAREINRARRSFFRGRKARARTRGVSRSPGHGARPPVHRRKFAFRPRGRTLRAKNFPSPLLFPPRRCINYLLLARPKRSASLSRSSSFSALSYLLVCLCVCVCVAKKRSLREMSFCMCLSLLVVSKLLDLTIERKKT